MRLTPEEIVSIGTCARHVFGRSCTVRLFGSRVDDPRRGGDIDLHIIAETADRATVANEIAFALSLEDRIGEQRIDVIAGAPHLSPRPVGRAVPVAEEGRVGDASHRDQRPLLEKLGAPRSDLHVDAIAELRRRLVHTDPDDPTLEAEFSNRVFARSSDLLLGLAGIANYARPKLGLDLDVPPVADRTS